MKYMVVHVAGMLLLVDLKQPTVTILAPSALSQGKRSMFALKCVKLVLTAKLPKMNAILDLLYVLMILDLLNRSKQHSGMTYALMLTKCTMLVILMVGSWVGTLHLKQLMD